MIKNILGFLILFFVGICFFFSCTKIDSDDSYPIIEFYSIDTIDHVQMKAGDTMYTNSYYLLRTRFRDNEGLSSYSIQIWSAVMKSSTDTFTLKSSITPLVEGVNDSAIYKKSFQNSNIWGIKDTSVTVLTNIFIESILTVRNVKYPTTLGPYYFKVSVIDTHGNLTKDSVLINVKRKPEIKTDPIPDIESTL